MKTLMTGLLLSLTFVSTTFGVDMGEIISSEVKSGEINVPQQEDAWMFSGELGDFIILHVCKTSGVGGFVLDVRVLDPDLNDVPFEPNRYGMLEFVLRQEGTYTILLSDNTKSDYGTYNISIVNLSKGPYSYPEDPDGQNIDSGETLDPAGTINVASDLDVFHFSGDTGDLIELHIVKMSGGNDFILDIRVLDPDLNDVPFEPNRYGMLEFVLSQKGKYTILLRDNTINGTGTYNITLVNLSQGPYSYPADPDGQDIDSGETLDPAGTINVASDLDVFHFSAETGRNVELHIIKTSGENDFILDVRVLDPILNEVPLDPDASSMFEFVPSQEGKYTILVRDNTINGIGTYNITISDFPCGIIYVDDTAEGANDGTSWINAYMNLQDALAEAATCQPTKIKVAQGVYTPDRTTVNPDGTGDRNATFQLISGVIVEGGYAGVAGDDPDARDVVAYETILSGDLVGDDVDDDSTYSDNSYHVVTADQTDATTVLDGFTITAGNADANDPDHAGGGLLVIGGNPVISNCIFLANQAGWSGGGVFCQGSGVTFSGCTFVRNTAAHGGGLYHLRAQDAVVEDSIFAMNECTYEGGTLALDGGNAQISACKFQENVASWSGGAIFVHPAEEKSHNITHCEFIANTAMGQGINKGGGAVMDRGNETALSHCIFQGNRSFGNPEEQSGLGGAVYCDGASTTLINCTFAGNFANEGHALACDVYEVPGDAIVSNCILWDGCEEIWIGPDSIVRASYSDIKFTDGEIYPGLDNINTDPNFALPGYWSDPNDPNLFADPSNPDAVWVPGDYHLMSAEGRWDPDIEGWVQDEYTSPCIDAGDPASDWSKEPEPNGGRINMGAYGGKTQASKTPDTYTLTYRAGPNGSIDGETTQQVKHGEDGTPVTPVPDAGYRFISWSDGSDADPRTDTNVTADLDVTANFERIPPYTLIYRAGPNGSISGSTEQEVYYGEDGTPVTPVPDAGYHFIGWSDGSDADPRIDTNVTTDVDVTANFECIPYTLTYRAGLNGSISGDTTQQVCHGEDGTAVTAVADQGYHFVNWSDGSMDNPRTDTNVTADVDVTANFDPNTYTLIYRAGPNGSIDGETSQKVKYGEDGTEVKPVPDAGYRFKDWSDGSDTDPRKDTNVTADLDVTANFEPNDCTLTIISSSGGSVTTPGEGIFTFTDECGSDVPIEATADEYYYFLKWTGSAVDAGKVADPRSASTTVHTDGDYSLKANFAAVNFILTVSSTDGGSVTRPGEGEIVIDGDSLIQLKAEADQNYKFVKWTGSAVDAGVVDDPYSPNTRIYINGNYNVKAHFAIDTYTLTISSTSGGSVTTPGEGAMSYNPGTQVSVVATPDEHYHFVGWTGSAVDAGKVADPGSAGTTVTVEGDYTLIANFEIDTYILTISSNNGGSVTTPGEGVFEYDYGTVVDLAATADSYYRFKFWTGPVADLISASTTITITEDITVSAVFVKASRPPE